MAENIIYCYSGGGNCLDMAKNIARELGDTDIYGGGLPGKVEEYAKTILISPDAYTFGIVQYAGYMGCGLYSSTGYASWTTGPACPTSAPASG